MTIFARPVALTFAAFALGSFGPAPQTTANDQWLAYLDPTTRLAGICSGGEAGTSMRAKLMIAAAVVQGAAPPDQVPSVIAKDHPVIATLPLQVHGE